MFNGRMDTLGKLYFVWHKHLKMHNHPIFDPDYARENLASLFETIFMLYLYICLFLLSFGLIYSMGYLQTETLLWLIITNGINDFVFFSSYVNQQNILSMALFLGTYLVATILIRESIEVFKATLHPKKEMIQKMIKKIIQK